MTIGKLSLRCLVVLYIDGKNRLAGKTKIGIKSGDLTADIIFALVSGTPNL